MRSLFWRIFASFWLAIALVAGLSLLLGHALNQDAWILSNHPALRNLPERWSQRYEEQGAQAAQDFLERRKRRFHVDTQVLDEDGQALVYGTFPPRAAAFEARQRNEKRLPWRRLTDEYTNPDSGKTYLFIYRIPHPELAEWHRDSLLWPLSALSIALVVLTALSLLLTLSITRPLGRLRGAVHDLGQTTYQQHSLARLADRRDEFGVLARDFNRMGARLQGLIGSQRQLLRDVSHELRSPLARLRIALALAERAEPAERDKLWPRLAQECDRLEGLISEILALARLDAEPGSAQPIEISVTRHAQHLLISLRDHGPGVPEELLEKLGEPFFRAPGQSAAGHGLGLAIARRSAERHGGRLLLANHPDSGFVASLELPLNGSAP